MPKKRKRLSPIGLAMLDLISNSLAATIILFIILASLRKPFIIPERINGTLFVRYELIDTVASPIHPGSSIWLDPPFTGNQLLPGEQRVYFGPGQISRINGERNLYGTFADCEGLSKKLRKNKKLIPPCAMVYNPIDSPFVHYLILRNPLAGKWRTGIIYEDHPDYEKKTKAVKAKMQAWFIAGQKGELSNLAFEDKLNRTTLHSELEFETPKWNEL